MSNTCKGKPYYITTAIAYTSGKPHIGNTYEIVLADAIARYRREQGYDVRFMTGTDEHGQKIEEKAMAAGKTPKEFVDEVSTQIKGIWDLMNTSYDKFIRTTDPQHEKQIQKMFKKMYAKGDIYKGYYEGLYCTPCESFFTESQLVDGKCPDCGRPVKPAKEEAYFFKMSKYADRLIEHINTHPEFIQPVARKNEMMNNFLLPGLQDLCVSRTSFKWGIPVDFDPNHVVYVWLDALSNYITGLGYNVDGDPDEECAAYANSMTCKPADPEGGKELWGKYWPADLHLIGKDIIRFHTIYWPIFLMSLDIPLPKQVFGHPWLLQGDGKMSKSKGNVLYADDLVNIFGVDAVRYFVLHEMPFDNDGVISWDLMIERFNSDLANILGNLVSRTIAMSNKYFEGTVTDAEDEGGPGHREADEDLKNTVLLAVERCTAKMNELRVADAITEVWSIFRRSNKYIDETCPWELAKDGANRERLQTVLYNLCESITIGASLLYSFMPETSKKILAELNTEKLDLEQMTRWGNYKSGNKVSEKPEILFARLKAEEIFAEVEKLQAAQKAAAGVPEEEKKEDAQYVDIEAKDIISYDDFAKLQMQVGVIEACEEVPKSKKLLKSKVRVGSQVRTILSGIKQYYTPEEMVGKHVMVLVNLEPREIAGVMSEGMLLCAEDDEGHVVLMAPEKAIKAGSEIC